MNFVRLNSVQATFLFNGTISILHTFSNCPIKQQLNDRTTALLPHSLSNTSTSTSYNHHSNSTQLHHQSAHSRSKPTKTIQTSLTFTILLRPPRPYPTSPPRYIIPLRIPPERLPSRRATHAKAITARDAAFTTPAKRRGVASLWVVLQRVGVEVADFVAGREGGDDICGRVGAGNWGGEGEGRK